MAHCTHKYGHETLWMAMIDVDEFFLLGHDGEDLCPYYRMACTLKESPPWAFRGWQKVREHQLPSRNLGCAG